LTPVRVFVSHNPEDREVYFGRALPRLRELVEVVVNPFERNLSTTELIDAAHGCQVIVAHRSTPGETALFNESDDLLAFLRCAVDISTVDIAAASRSGVLVARADKTYVASTAELALGLFLAVSRQIAESTIDYRRGVEPPQLPGRQVRGQTAGIIGAGSIGRYLATLLRALGLQVLVSDPQQQSDHEQVDLHELLRRSDVVFPLAPASPSTAGLIGRPELAAMQRGAILINVSRGELLDEQAVADSLDSGQLGGVGLDVGQSFDERPSMSLARRRDVVATPHLGGLTPENADAQSASSLEQVTAIIAGDMPPRSVNPEAAAKLLAWWSR
jgi:D-3-phosphoglycerate dehydrogenase / 2-oxoglutarate reductase